MDARACAYRQFIVIVFAFALESNGRPATIICHISTKSPMLGECVSDKLLLYLISSFHRSALGAKSLRPFKWYTVLVLALRLPCSPSIRFVSIFFVIHFTVSAAAAANDTRGKCIVFARKIKSQGNSERKYKKKKNEEKTIRFHFFVIIERRRPTIAEIRNGNAEELNGNHKNVWCGWATLYYALCNLSCWMESEHKYENRKIFKAEVFRDILSVSLPPSETLWMAHAHSE